jgi:hypothetical protein
LQALDNNPASVVVLGIGVGGTAQSERRRKIGWILLFKNSCSAGLVFLKFFFGDRTAYQYKKIG